MGVRKRVGAVLVAFAVLAVPAFAKTVGVNLHGPVGTGANDAIVDITLVVKNGKLTKVVRFEWANVPVACASYPAPAYDSDLTTKHMPVSRKGKFHGTVTVNGGRTTYTIAGRFKNAHKASGTLRIAGTVPGCLHGDSGVLKWKAS